MAHDVLANPPDHCSVSVANRFAEDCAKVDWKGSRLHSPVQDASVPSASGEESWECGRHKIEAPVQAESLEELNVAALRGHAYHRVDDRIRVIDAIFELNRRGCHVTLERKVC